MSSNRTNRFALLVHYVCAKAPPGKLGSVKLNKILWFSDKLAFRKRGESISGETAYIKRRLGPVPKNILKTLYELEEKGFIKRVQVRRYGYNQWQYKPVGDDPDVSAFDKEEIEIIDDVINDICNYHTADSISELSHDKIWEETPMGGEIPLIATLAENAAELTAEDIEWARQSIEQEN